MILPKCCEGFLAGTRKQLFIVGVALIWHSCSMTGLRFFNGPISCLFLGVALIWHSCSMTGLFSFLLVMIVRLEKKAKHAK